MQNITTDYADITTQCKKISKKKSIKKILEEISPFIMWLIVACGACYVAVRTFIKLKILIIMY